MKIAGLAKKCALISDVLKGRVTINISHPILIHKSVLLTSRMCEKNSWCIFQKIAMRINDKKNATNFCQASPRSAKVICPSVICVSFRSNTRMVIAIATIASLKNTSRSNQRLFSFIFDFVSIMNHKLKLLPKLIVHI